MVEGKQNRIPKIFIRKGRFFPNYFATVASVTRWARVYAWATGVKCAGRETLNWFLQNQSDSAADIFIHGDYYTRFLFPGGKRGRLVPTIARVPNSTPADRLKQSTLHEGLYWNGYGRIVFEGERQNLFQGLLGKLFGLEKSGAETSGK